MPVSIPGLIVAAWVAIVVTARSVARRIGRKAS